MEIKNYKKMAKLIIAINYNKNNKKLDRILIQKMTKIMITCHFLMNNYNYRNLKVFLVLMHMIYHKMLQNKLQQMK